MGIARGLIASGTTRKEIDLQKPVLQARALDLDMVGELEVAFKIPLGNALVDQVALLLTAALLVAADR